MIRPTPIGLNPVKLKYYSLMISLDKFIGSCNVFSPKNVFQKKQNTKILNHLILLQTKMTLKQ